MTEIQLPVLDASGKRTIDESVPAEPIGPGRFRLLASPGLVQGLAAGDEVELAPSQAQGFRVLQRGGPALHLGLSARADAIESRRATSPRRRRAR